MTYEQKKLEEIREKHFTEKDNFSSACLTADNICAKVYKEHGACYVTQCVELLERSYIGEIITDSEDLNTFWYCASQRHHEKEKQELVKEMKTKDYTQVKDIENFTEWDKAEIYTQSGSMFGDTTMQGRIQKHEDQSWFIPKGKRSKGYKLSRMDVQDYFIKQINSYNK